MRRALIVFFLALGCGSSNVSAPEASGATDDGAVSNAETAGSEDVAAIEDAAAGYPPGPYGKTVGSVLADLSVAGYLRDEPTGLATLSTYGEASFATLRAHALVKYALIHVGGYT